MTASVMTVKWQVRERLGKTKEALPILQQALSHYQDEYNKGGEQLDSSLIAKSHMSVAHALENLNQLDDAVYHVREVDLRRNSGP